MSFEDFKNPNEIFSSVVIAAICQDIHPQMAGLIVDKTMLASTPAAPKDTLTSALVERFTISTGNATFDLEHLQK